MNKKNITILTIIAITLTLVFTIASTYSVIINVTNNNGVHEIIDVITIRDLFTTDDGSYNDMYYDVRNELNITEDEANLLIDSDKLNENLQIVLDSIVDYKVDNNIDAKLSNDEIYNLIIDGLNNTQNITDELKNKVITKAQQYKQDISDYVYDIEVSVLGSV